MAVTRGAWRGQLGYGALFVVVLPLLLLAWARATRNVVSLALPPWPYLGATLAMLGLLLMSWAMLALWHFGEGLPMNAYPPPKFVQRGPYALVSHPIYLGAVLLCAGLSWYFQSASGFWLVTPVLAAASIALVLGYETHDLAARFGVQRKRAWLSLIASSEARPNRSERACAFVSCVLGWMIGYELIALSGASNGEMRLALPSETSWPVIEWAEPIYFSTYLAVAALPFVPESRRALREFQVRGLWSMLLIFPLFSFLPVVSPPRSFVPDGLWGELLKIEQGLDTAANAFPSFHVVWALIAAQTLGQRWPSWRLGARLWALLVAASCVATGMHSVLDVLAGLLAGALVLRLDAVWRALQRGAERLANSWRAAHFGPVRVINHGAYAGMGAFAAFALVEALLGPKFAVQAAVLAGFGLVFAAAWAQVIEGSPRLSRPYGFYGGVLGICLGAGVMDCLGSDGFSLLAAYAVCGPLLQSFGRLRCLVQGCCHGAPASAEVGIRYYHPMSRVCRLTAYRALPLHPTQLYSVLWNVLVGLVISRLWTLRCSLPLICGMYLICTGLGRFVEESYRGEPQTPVYGRLRLYQWIAIATLLIGGALTTLEGPRSSGAAALHAGGWWLAALVGLIVAAALGVDFPESKRRFSRLA
ncbi:MAG TPA: prolipoprotein diacylglyceryl transferase family protein [Polyangiaceae bacterium]|nr:prolipoprotein diacylglyceryl transferase family protein [Polyangiaceae bacterium]